MSNHTKPRFICFCIWLALSAIASAEQRPNVIVLLTDDLGYKDIGCYDGPVKTPALDGLAAGGVRFTDFYSGAAVCSPSRATTLTGRQHLRCGIYSWINDWEQNSHLLTREVTLAEVLKKHGYETVHLGKWHLGTPTRQKPNKPTPCERVANGDCCQWTSRSGSRFIPYSGVGESRDCGNRFTTSCGSKFAGKRGRNRLRQRPLSTVKV